jgi:RNA polymerase sigma-70 factor (ECF subfamily)
MNPQAETKPAPAPLQGAGGDLGALYRAHAQSVARWAARLGGPAMDVEDVVQEVFLIAHRLLPGFRGEAKITTWLFRITHNVVRHRRRKEKLRRFFSLQGPGVDDAAARLPSMRPTPIEEMLRREAAQTVYQVLDTMSEKYRTVFILFEMEGLPGEEIATLTGQRLSTTWVWLHRARAQFMDGLARIQRREAP